MFWLANLLHPFGFPDLLQTNLFWTIRNHRLVRISDPHSIWILTVIVNYLKQFDQAMYHQENFEVIQYFVMKIRRSFSVKISSEPRRAFNKFC